MGRRRIEIAGQRFFRLTVIDYAGPKGLWNVKCDCGTEKVLTRCHILRSKSCGCYRQEMAGAQSLTHGEARRGKSTPEYRAWCGAIKRCEDSNHENWNYYGGRGIKVCGRWRNSYESFLEDMGRKPSAKHSIDRIDNDGDYEPSNCQWALSKQQMRNRRGRRMVGFQGRRMPASEAAELAGVDYDTFLERLNRGWSEERALLTPALGKFGGAGSERYSHSSEAISLVKIASAVKAYNGLSEGERAAFERVIEP